MYNFASLLFICLTFPHLLFYFYNFQESDNIPEDSYCRVEHVVSGQWLHACTGKNIIREQFLTGPLLKLLVTSGHCRIRSRGCLEAS